MIRWFYSYKRWHNPRSRLLLVGSHAGFERYIAMLHQFIARIGATDIYFQGHVTNEELVAYYELADVFLCASEHEGFCVPLIEAFHMGVPVIAYAAAAVPATMDGGGILFTDKNPAEVAGLIDTLVTNEAFTDRVVRTQEDALERLEARGFRRHGVAFRRLRPSGATFAAPLTSLDFWEQVKVAEELEDVRAHRPACLSGTAEARERSVTVNQWVPAAHKGDAIGDSARRVRHLLRRQGHRAEIYALTVDEELRSDVVSFDCAEARAGDITILHFAVPSPMTEAFANLPRGRVLQYHNVTPAHFFAPYEPGVFGSRPSGARNWRRWPDAQTPL